MGWAVGFDTNWNRDIGYGVPAHCDHPDCKKVIDRGLAHVCGGELYGGESGCGLHFCEHHLSGHPHKCERCTRNRAPFTPKPDHHKWIKHKLKDPSWKPWRDQNRDQVKQLREQYERHRARVQHHHED